MADSVPGRVEWHPEMSPPLAVGTEWPAARLPQVGETVLVSESYRGSVRLRIERVGWELPPRYNRGPYVAVFVVPYVAVFVVHGVEEPGRGV